MLATSRSGLSIEAISAFSDNYIWLLRRGGTDCAAVDPGDATPVIRKLERDRLTLRYVLLTHHHLDHVGGVQRLAQFAPDLQVFGPEDARIGRVDIVCREGDEIELPDLSLRFGVLDVPGHTRSHIAFHGHQCLFCGDTMFSVGCGKLFEGTPEQMQASLDKFAALPGDTRVYCGHEYTLANCRFALQVEPGNARLKTKAAEAERARAEGRITLPGRMEEELAVNPFLRTREDSVVQAARERDPSARSGAPVLGVIRRWKDGY